MVKFICFEKATGHDYVAIYIITDLRFGAQRFENAIDLFHSFIYKLVKIVEIFRYQGPPISNDPLLLLYALDTNRWYPRTKVPQPKHKAYHRNGRLNR